MTSPRTIPNKQKHKSSSKKASSTVTPSSVTSKKDDSFNPRRVKTAASSNTANIVDRLNSSAAAKPTTLSGALDLDTTNTSLGGADIKRLLVRRRELLKQIKRCNADLARDFSQLVHKNCVETIRSSSEEIEKILQQLRFPKSHEWILDIVEDTKLPSLGLPTKWERTQEEYSKVAFDPATDTTYNIKMKVEKKLKANPISFINATAGKNLMPGTNAPAAARYTRYQELANKGGIVTNARGEVYAICPTHGDFVKVESYQSDHMQPIAAIQTKQLELVEALNQNKNLAETVMNCPGIEKFFVKAKFSDSTSERYYGTMLYYELYYNDIENLWLICQACNLHKKNKDTLKYLKTTWTFGEEFSKYVEKRGLNKEGILIKTSDDQQEGLANVAIKWFWKRHASFIATETVIFTGILKPLQVFNQKVDRLEGGTNNKRAKRNRDSLDITVHLTELSANTRIKFSHESDEEKSSTRETSDDDEAVVFRDHQGKVIRLTEQERKEFAKRVGGEIKNHVKSLLQAKAQEVYSQRAPTSFP